MLSEIGIDKSFALAQALCVCKSAQSARDLEFMALLEKNYILKEKQIEQESVFQRWRADIETSAAKLSRLSSHSATSPGGLLTEEKSTDDRVISSSDDISMPIGEKVDNLTSVLKKEHSLMMDVTQYQQRLTTVEMTNIELQSAVDQLTNQLEESSRQVQLLTTDIGELEAESANSQENLRTQFHKKYSRCFRKQYLYFIFRLLNFYFVFMLS